MNHRRLRDREEVSSLEGAAGFEEHTSVGLPLSLTQISMVTSSYTGYWQSCSQAEWMAGGNRVREDGQWHCTALGTRGAAPSLQKGAWVSCKLTVKET